jgi:hypothetical protein
MDKINLVKDKIAHAIHGFHKQLAHALPLKDRPCSGGGNRENEGAANITTGQKQKKLF